MLALTFTGFRYGNRFWKSGNVLLGIEWFILGASALNFVIWSAFGLHFAYFVTMTCDAFSRSVGFPVIGTLGLAKVTHGLNLSDRTKWTLIIGGFALSIGMMAWERIQPTLPYVFLFIGLVWNGFLVYFAIRLARVGETFHAVAVVLSSAALLVIGILEGIVPIPGEEANLIFNLYFLAAWVWAIAFAEIYFAYRAFEGRTDPGARHGVPEV